MREIVPSEDEGTAALQSMRQQHSSLFESVGRLVVRYRYLVVVFWIVAAILSVKLLPSLSSVSNNNNSSFLPKNTPSLAAARLAAPFERGTLPSAALVAASMAGPLTAADQLAVSHVEAAIRRVTGVVVVTDQGTSGDGVARKAAVALSSKLGFGSGADTLVSNIRATFGRVPHPSTLSFYLTGEVPTSVDNQKSSNKTLRNIQLFSVLFILVLLLVVFRSVLAPVLTLLPPVLVLVLAGPVVAEASKVGVPVSPITQILLSVLILGAGTDYGLFLVFRVREELRRGLAPQEAVIQALSRIGETITFSAATVIAAMLCLLLATFGFYYGLGPALAIGIGIMLLAGLTLTPAILAILGRTAFWPSDVRPGRARIGLWGRIAGNIVRYPAATLAAGILVFGGLAVAALHYAPEGFTQNGSTAGNSQSAQGTNVISAHYPAAQANPNNLLFAYATPVWQNTVVLEQATNLLRAQHVLRSISGPLDPNGSALSPSQLARLHQVLGQALLLPPVPPAGIAVSPKLYNAYRSTSQFVSADGRAVQFYATLRAGAADTRAAMQATPSVRKVVGTVAARTRAVADGVAGEAAISYDISNASTTDLQRIVPVVLIAIAILLAIVLRSLIAPLYLIASVGLSYLAALGLAVVVFMGLGHGPGLNFILPFFMFIFLMALGEDYNILVMTRIREEAHHGSLTDAVTRAINATGGTVTSAGMVLAGTFMVLAFVGSGQIQQIGFSIAAGILMDTFLVRTLLIPSTVSLLGRWNWWPSHLTQEPALDTGA